MVHCGKFVFILQKGQRNVEVKSRGFLHNHTILAIVFLTVEAMIEGQC